MHNGVGLQTVRGSGTSGFVEKSLAHVQRMRQHQIDFQKQMKMLKENPLPPPRKANSEIVKHEQKRKIENHMFKFAKELREKGESEEEIQRRVHEAREIMTKKLEEAPTVVNTKDAHQKAFAKEREMEKLKEALGVRNDYKLGSAFDFETQEQKRLEGIAEREKKRKEMKLEKLKERIEKEDKQKKAIEERERRAIEEREKRGADEREKREERKGPSEEREKRRERSREREERRNRDYEGRDRREYSRRNYEDRKRYKERERSSERSRYDEKRGRRD